MIDIGSANVSSDLIFFFLSVSQMALPMASGIDRVGIDFFTLDFQQNVDADIIGFTSFSFIIMFCHIHL